MGFESLKGLFLVSEPNENGQCFVTTKMQYADSNNCIRFLCDSEAGELSDCGGMANVLADYGEVSGLEEFLADTAPEYGARYDNGGLRVAIANDLLGAVNAMVQASIILSARATEYIKEERENNPLCFDYDDYDDEEDDEVC